MHISGADNGSSVEIEMGRPLRGGWVAHVPRVRHVENELEACVPKSGEA